MDIVDNKKNIINPDIYYNGQLVDTENINQVISECKRRIGRFSKDPEAHGNLGLFYIVKGSYDKAIREYRNAIRLKPYVGHYHNGLARALLGNDMIDEAYIECNKALKLEPENSEFLGTLGLYYFKRDMWDELINTTNKIMEKEKDVSDSDNANLYNNLGVAYLYKNMLQDAENAFNEVIRLDPNRAHYHSNYGIVLKEIGRYNDAIIEYKEAVRLKPDCVDYHYSLGTSYSLKGEIKEAVNEYIDALKLDPDYVHAQTAILKLCTEKEKENISEYVYDVAISFAGENREIVRSIADKLTANGVKVFFSDYYQDMLWGEDQVKIFEEIFTNKARYCIIMVSKYYIEKAWPTLELNSAISRHMKQNKGYILPIKLDNTKLPGLPDTYGYINFESVDAVVELTLKKIKK